ncbi:MAG: hypothetical protein AB7Q16_19155 [Vicinamibacterales bacterium]
MDRLGRQPAVQRRQHAALVDGVHAAPEVRVHLGADGRQRVAMAGDVGQADAGQQPGSADGEVVDIAAVRARAGAGVEQAPEPGQFNGVVSDVIAAPYLAARQA